VVGSASSASDIAVLLKQQNAACDVHMYIRTGTPTPTRIKLTLTAKAKQLGCVLHRSPPKFLGGQMCEFPADPVDAAPKDAGGGLSFGSKLVFSLLARKEHNVSENKQQQNKNKNNSSLLLPSPPPSFSESPHSTTQGAEEKTTTTAQQQQQQNEPSQPRADGSTPPLSYDLVVLATGYRATFPFLDTKQLDLFSEDGASLKQIFQQVWYIPNPTLCFLGLPNAVLPPSALMDFQAIWVAKVLAGKCKLPSPMVESKAPQFLAFGTPAYCNTIARFANLWRGYWLDFFAAKFWRMLFSMLLSLFRSRRS